MVSTKKGARCPVMAMIAKQSLLTCTCGARKFFPTSCSGDEFRRRFLRRPRDPVEGASISPHKSASIRQCHQDCHLDEERPSRTSGDADCEVRFSESAPV